MNLEHRIQIGKIEQFANQRAGIGALQLRIPGLRPGMQKHKFTHARAVDETDTAKIKQYLTAVCDYLAHQTRQRSRLITVDDAAVAVNDHDIFTIASLQIELQRRLLKLCSGQNVYLTRLGLRVRPGGVDRNR
jgi:hypothetical protein